VYRQNTLIAAAEALVLGLPGERLRAKQGPWIHRFLTIFFALIFAVL
jgi:hypothetical protein